MEGATEDVQEMVHIDPTRPIPSLRAKLTASDHSPAIASDDERFWKQSGKKGHDERAIFADGRPVDQTYRARRIISDDDAPEALGVASGYKPETIERPIPRMRARARTPRGNGPIVVFGVAVVSVCALWMVFRWTSGSEPSTKPSTQELSQGDGSNFEEAKPVSAPVANAERPKPIESAVAKSVPVVSRVSRPTPKVDLKALLNPSRDSVGGRWEALEGGFISPEGGSVIRIPYNPPPEYRLTVKVLKGSKEMVGIGLVTAPTSVLITLDSYPDTRCESQFDVVDGRGLKFHTGSRVLPLFEMSTVVCTIRKNLIAVETNGREIGRWDGDFRRLSVHPVWAYGGNGLFIGSVGKGTVIRSIELEPLRDTESTSNTEPALSGSQTNKTNKGTGVSDYLVTLSHLGRRQETDGGRIRVGGLSGKPAGRKPLIFERVRSSNGIYIHASRSDVNWISHRLDKRFNWFRSEAIIPVMYDWQGPPKTPLEFEVVADGLTIWRSTPISFKGDHQPCSVSVKGVGQLMLRVRCPGMNNWALAARAEPRLYVSSPD
jgi:hypothetical protein